MLWGYCAERHSRINNLTARKLLQLEGRNAHFSITGKNSDISNFYQFVWYEYCYYREHNAGFPLQQDILSRMLRPANIEGN